MLPLSHDEVVHGKGSLLSRMPGDDWQQFANLRLMFAYMFTHPGTKLLFMGGEFGQRSEWNHDAELDWSVLETESHLGIQNLVRDLNKLYRDERALYRFNFQPEGFQWVDTMDYENSVISWLRHSDKADESLLIIGNFTPRVLPDYVVGVPSAGKWNVVLNSDDVKYWGSGVQAGKDVQAEKTPRHGQPASIRVTLPPLAIIVIRKAQ